MIPPGLGHALIVWLLRNSAGAAVVALLVLLAQWLLGRRISARWRHNLWLLVIVRLLVPPLPAVKVPAPPHLALLRPLFRHVQQVTVSTQATQPPTATHEVAPVAALTVGTDAAFPPTEIGSGKSQITLDEAAPVEAHSVAVQRPWARNVREGPTTGGKLAPSTAHDGVAPIIRPLRTSRARIARSAPQPTEFSRSIPWFPIVAGTWGIVALALLLKTLFGSIRIGIAARGLRPLHDPSLVELLNDCCRLLNIPAPPTLLEAPPESGPALVGLMHPRLLLPPCVVDQFAWRELRHVILHELVHLKRRDILVNYVASLVQAVHWFNPLVWLAAARMRAERELACDEAVLSVSPWREGRAYGSTIVKLLELLSRGAVPAGAMGVIGHKALMHRRIAMIARFDGSRRHWSASGLLLTAALTGTALAGAVRAQVQPAQEPPAAQAATESKEPSPDEAGAAAAVRQEATRGEAPAAATPEAKEPAETPPPADAAPAAGALAGESAATAEPPAADTAVTTPADPTLPRAQSSGDARAPRGFGRGIGGGGGFGGGGGRVMGGSGRGGGAGPGPFGGPMMGRAGGFGGGGVVAPSEPQFATIEDAAAAKADAKTLEKLQRPMPIQVDNEPLGDVLNMLAQKGGFDVLVDNRALGEASIDQNTPVQINIREPQPIEQLLHFVLRQAGGDEVGFSLMHGVVLVSNRVELARHVVTRVYDVGDLGSPDDVQQTIDQTIGNQISARFLKGKLIVTTSEPNQREVAKLLALLRQEGPHTEATGGPRGPESARAFPLKGLTVGPGVKVTADERTNSLTVNRSGGEGGELEVIHRTNSAVPAASPTRGLDSAFQANTPAQGKPPQPAAR